MRKEIILASPGYFQLVFILLELNKQGRIRKQIRIDEGTLLACVSFTWAKRTEDTRLRSFGSWMFSQERLRSLHGDISLRMAAHNNWICSGHLGEHSIFCSRPTISPSSLQHHSNASVQSNNRLIRLFPEYSWPWDDLPWLKPWLMC